MSLIWTEFNAFVPQDAAEYSKLKISDLMATLSRHLLIFSHSVFCLFFAATDEMVGLFVTAEEGGRLRYFGCGEECFSH